jgi:hypothetical protein
MSSNGIPEWMIQVSIFVNERTGGRKGWSLCARFYENRLNGVPHFDKVVAVCDAIFFFDKQHCRKAWLLRNS